MLIDPIEKELKKLQEENSRLKILSEVDGLTGLYNRLAGERLINDRLHKNAGGNFMVVDVDGFKKINDQYGHLFGDDVLRGLAALMKEIFGGENLVGRFGGDEFVIFMSVKQDQNFIEERCRQIRQQFLNLPPDQFMVTRLSVTVCGSIYQKGDDYQRLFDRADQRLITEKSLRKKRPADADNRPENT